ncbi:MAG: amidohydrolase family protein [Acidobacteria bacterium]|nr:amidohydrolase family protein [Acidobacteriota bacterium]
MNNHRNKLMLYAMGLMLTLALKSSLLLAQQTADTILHNGKILTVDPSFTVAEAIAIRGSQIAAVGTNQQILAMVGPNTKKIDLKGLSVIPGIIDTHNHIHDYSENSYGGEIGSEGLLAYPIDWAAVKTTEDVLNQVRGTIAKHQPAAGEWLYFASMNDDLNDPNIAVMIDGLTRWELDKAAPNHKIVMALAWPNVNGIVVNSAAWDAVFPQHEASIKKYGRFWIDSAGRPEGHIEAPANRFWLSALPTPPPSNVAPIYRKYMEELAAEGVTTLVTRLPEYAIAAFQLLESRGEMLLRLPYGKESFFGITENLASDMKEIGKLMGTGSEKMWIISAAPSALDGAGTRSCTAIPRQTAFSSIDSWWPNGQCNLDIEYKGAKGAAIQGNYFREWFDFGARDGVRLANTHVTGERTIKMMLGLMDRYAQQYGPDSVKTWAFDHCFLVDPADLPHAAKLGAQFSCYSQINGSDAVAKTYGDKIANTFPIPVKSMMKAGVLTAYESDSDSKAKWKDLRWFMERKDPRGKVWAPQERLDHQEVLRFFTRNGADYVLRPDKIGSLEVGKWADLAVLDRDFMATPPEQMSEVQPQMTMVGGKIVFAHPQFSQENGISGPGVVISTLADLKKRRNPLGISRR